MTEYRQVSVDTNDDAVIVKLHEHCISNLSELQKLNQELSHLIEQEKPRKLVVDFSCVTFLPSEAIGALISLSRKASAHQGAVKLCCLPPEVLEIFLISQLNRVFDLHKDVAEALASF